MSDDFSRSTDVGLIHIIPSLSYEVSIKPFPQSNSFGEDVSTFLAKFATVIHIAYPEPFRLS